uniref:non-specific serine/threonine protein kinase n=1 Tax=Amphora coffeiformis TaxID=265554 RepID=A0A7S3LF63_9STRA|mmetsp:Transcript_20092/g.38103  ORF Transcript_20092/g.38103 Transcript_20092/m.38103 type:complete len:393 (+) Transcript_20092:120-1298(+)
MLASLWKLLNSLWQALERVWESWTAPSLVVGNYQVRVGKKIAEGGFSWVFKATDQSTGRKYALKRIHCPDPEILRACKEEAAVHNAVQGDPHTMELLGMTIEKQTCYMLFPLYAHSLRDIVNRRTGVLDANSTKSTSSHNHPYGRSSTSMSSSSYKEPAPWPELRALQLFHGIMMGIKALHDAGYSHRDIKCENVLLDNEDEPVLMDFGSAGPLEAPIETRAKVRNMVEQASQHTTLPYRPPELLEGGLRPGDAPVDYRKVDVWSAGCTLFAMLYGASPFEGEFSRQSGRFRVTDCTPLSILKDELPRPPPQASSASWYSAATIQLIQDMLRPNRQERATVDQALDRLRHVITDLGGNWQTTVFRDFADDDGDEYDEEEAGGIVLIGRQRRV